MFQTLREQNIIGGKTEIALLLLDFGFLWKPAMVRKMLNDDIAMLLIGLSS